MEIFLIIVVLAALLGMVVLIVRSLVSRKGFQESLREEQLARLKQYDEKTEQKLSYFRSPQFFKMKNKGMHPCDEIDMEYPIQYEAYVPSSRFYQCK